MLGMEVNDLKARLLAGEDLALVDIRPEEAFADWRIPGTVNMPIIEAMRANDPQPLLDRLDELPKDRPIVFICNRGASSMKSALIVQPHGFTACSLNGGMIEWSMVHSEAALPVEENSPGVAIQIRRNGKGCLSYLMGAKGEAIVVDPCLDCGVYQSIAKREGLKITTILETHVHADHFSRARTLATETGARFLLPQNDRVTFKYEPIHDGDEIAVGGWTIRALATPGHTGESMSYLCNESILLSGDTLFTDAVGRPDLEKGDAGAEDGARILHNTLHERMLPLPDETLICPAHTGLTIDLEGPPICARLGDVRSTISLLDESEGEFVAAILDRLGPKPPSFDEIIALNEGKEELEGRNPAAIEVGPNRCAVC